MNLKKLKIVKVERIKLGVLYSTLKLTFKVPNKSEVQTATWLWCDAPVQLKNLVEKGN